MTDRDHAIALDRDDPLAPLRDLFDLPEGVIYLDGNSLGALPRATPGVVARVVAEEWGRGLIRSWNDAGWIDMAARIAGKLAGVVGAAPGSVAVCDSTSVNLFKLLGAGLALRPERRVILSERGNFPTDLYVAEGLARLLDRGHRLRLVERHELDTAMDAGVAVALLTHVDFRSGAMHDMAATTALAHRHGALVLWDLAHSAGAVPVDLGGSDADLAVGCGYKFLNGGPGAPAFLYVAPRLHDRVRFPLSGWLGHAAPFAFEPEYRPAAGIGAATVGTPPVLSLAALEVGVDAMLRAPMPALRAKSLSLSELFRATVAERCRDPALRLLSPADATRGGSQVSFRHPEAPAVMRALIARGVIGDVRTPDVLRFGLAPLYLRHMDVHAAALALCDVLDRESWREAHHRVAAGVVT